MACIARDDVEAACSKLRKMSCFIHKKITPAFAEDGIEKIHPNGAGDPGGCSRKLLIHDVPPEVRQFFELLCSDFGEHGLHAFRTRQTDLSDKLWHQRFDHCFAAQTGANASDDRSSPTYD